MVNLLSPDILNAILPIAGVVLTVVLNRLGIRLPMQPVNPGPVKPVDPVAPSPSPSPVNPANPACPTIDAMRLMVREELNIAVTRLRG